MTFEAGKPSQQEIFISHGFSRQRKPGFWGFLRGTLGEREAQRTEGQHKVARGMVRCGFKNSGRQMRQKGVEEGRVGAWKTACGIF